MDLTLTDDQAVIQSTARELLAARASNAHVQTVETEPAGYSATVWKEVVELGWPGLALPVEHGGVGEGFVELCLLVEEVGRAQTPMPLLPTAAVCGVVIDRFGSKAQRAEWLADIVAGEVFTFALATERGGWSEPGRGVTARAYDEGFSLDGTAWFVPYAGVATQLLVVAHAPDGVPVVAVVDAAADGVRAHRLDVVGPDPLYRVDLTEVAVPPERVLGGSDNGVVVAEAMTSHGAAATCAEMVGGAQRVLDMTVEHARQREQFGRPIGSFQAVQHHCADMAIDLLTSRYLAYEAIWRLAEGLDAATEVAMAKAAVGEAYQRVVALGHQVHGAIGFTREHELHRYLRHATSSALAFGDSGFHWDRLADRCQTLFAPGSK